MLRGASAEALADLRELKGTRTLADAATVGAELFGVAALLRRDAALRRALTDSSVEGEAKAGLAQTVFGAAVSKATLVVVSEAVRRRWTVSHDLPEAIEHLGVVSSVKSAGKDGNRISDELFAVRRMIDAHPQFRAALSDASRSVEDRTELLRGLLDSKTLPATSALVVQAVARGRGTVDATLQDFLGVAAGTLGETVATVHTARELSAQDEERLGKALGKQYDTKVHLHVEIDSDLVGGMRIEIRDDVIDGTLLSRLDEARRRLAG